MCRDIGGAWGRCRRGTDHRLEVPLSSSGPGREDELAVLGSRHRTAATSGAGTAGLDAGPSRPSRADLGDGPRNEELALCRRASGAVVADEGRVQGCGRGHAASSPRTRPTSRRGRDGQHDVRHGGTADRGLGERRNGASNAVCGVRTTEVEGSTRTTSAPSSRSGRPRGSGRVATGRPGSCRLHMTRHRLEPRRRRRAPRQERGRARPRGRRVPRTTRHPRGVHGGLAKRAAALRGGHRGEALTHEDDGPSLRSPRRRWDGVRTLPAARWRALPRRPAPGLGAGEWG